MSFQTGPTATQVDLGCAVAQVLGHYRPVLELVARRNPRRALVHAQHPMIEVLPRIERALSATDTELTTEFGRSLAAAATLVRNDRPTSQLDKGLNHLNDVARECLEAIAGEHVNSPGYAVSLVVALVDSAAEEYALALELDEVRRPPEYEDAYGFLRQASRMFDGFEHRLSADRSSEARDVLTELKDLIPGIDVPDELPSLDVVMGAASRFRDSLASVPGFVEAALSTEEHIAAVRSALQETLTHYAGNNPQRAMDAAGRALLHHFQPLADLLGEDASADVRRMIGVDLRRSIAERAELASLRAMVRRALDALDRLRFAPTGRTAVAASLGRKVIGVQAAKESPNLR